jgi:putative transposase
VWSHVKRNLATNGVDHRAAVVRNRLTLIQYRPDLLTSFVAQIDLALDPEPP